jgi:hypothetical protein
LSVIEKGMTITHAEKDKTITPSNSSEYEDADGVASEIDNKLK